MQTKLINRKMLVSGADYFSVVEINPYSKQADQPDIELAKQEHNNVIQAFKQAGIEIIKVPAPSNCQDGIYVANWAFCWQNKCILSSLPNLRQAEMPYAKHVMEDLGFKPITPPYRFSGQGDTLACGRYLFVGSNYRTDERMHQFLAQEFDCELVGLKAIPLLDENSKPVINKLTGWPDSFFYDLDLALGIINEQLIIWCPDAFMAESRDKLESLPIDKIAVSLDEAKNGFACNLVSTGNTVIMSSRSPALEYQLRARGLEVITPNINQLSKGGGYIRCCSLTI